MKWVGCIAWLVMMLVLGACQAERRGGVTISREVGVTISQEAGVNPWSKLALNNDPADFHFVIMSDRNGQNRAGVFEGAIDKVNLLQPEFVMSIGDFIRGYSQKDAELAMWWDEFQGHVGRLEMPFFYVPGNHDLTNPTGVKHWKERLGRTYYHFMYRNVLFLCINTADPFEGNKAHISAEQAAYMVNVLRAHPNPRWTFVFMHAPMWLEDGPTGWTAIEEELKGRGHTVFAGHVHTYCRYERNGQSYFTLATTGGGMKEQLKKPELGSFDHITWVTMKKEGPRVANLVLSGILDENVCTPRSATVLKDAVNEIILQIDSVYVPTSEFTQGGTKLRVTNNASEPMKFSGQFLANAHMLITPPKCDFTVAPHSVQTVDLYIQALKPTSVWALTPFTFNGTGTFQLTGQVPLVIDQSATFGIERYEFCTPRQGSAVVIDGQLGEWSELPLTGDKSGERGMAREDLREREGSYRFAVQHDERYVYIAVEVKDDKAVFNPKLFPWEQDGVEIRLDARPDPVRSQNRGLKDSKEILLISVSPDPKSKEMVVYKRENIPEGVQFVSVRTAEGHNTEVAIPVEYFIKRQGKGWEAFRLNIAVNDFDREGEAGKQLWWRPDWRSKGNVMGSGTFLRR